MISPEQRKQMRRKLVLLKLISRKKSVVVREYHDADYYIRALRSERY
jgi:hypothetical protein